ncbi:nitroreductase family protein [Lederbergia lenta]|uniref:Nitroreductase family protein n=1 Tax=Lederbergia lenta TaxID=1467 RepID=A0A2X4WUR3_LEDLE|nr:nitroreductase family protein [Lederbergia lenta]MEC2323396.1 nitroreductase family protein [Lederbergia lenta]SQI63348.1 nitroreductase family protein [Lederbergia lenta]
MIKTEQDFYTAVEERRSVYGISKEKVVSDERIIEVIEHAVKHAPSAFNSQSGRVVVLLGENHDKQWNITEAALKEVVPAENFQPTAEKMEAFRNGYGTVLFFEDQSVVKSLEQQFPLYKDAFAPYSLQSAGMLQYIVWTALEVEGFGATLQHYQPLIDEAVQKMWGVPENWKLLAQMPFGKPTAAPGEKQFNSIDERMKVFK